MSCENRKKSIGLTYHIVTNSKTKLHSASLPYFPLFFFVFTRPSKRIKPGDKKFKKLSTVLSRSFHGGPLVTVSHKTRAWIDLFFFGNCAGAVRGKRAFEVLRGTGGIFLSKPFFLKTFRFPSIFIIFSNCSVYQADFIIATVYA